MSAQLHLAVIGLSAFGRSVASTLAQKGADVIVIDQSRERIEEFQNEVSAALILDATDERALRAQNLERTDGVVVALGEDFETTVLVLSLLLELGVSNIVVQVTKAIEKRIVLKLGATEAVFASEQMGVRVAQRLALGNVLEATPVGQGYSFASLRVPAEFVGKRIQDLKLRETYRLNVVTVFDAQPGAGTQKLICRGLPTPDFTLEPNDVLYVFGHDDDLKALVE